MAWGSNDVSDEAADLAYEEWRDGWEHEYEFTDDLPELDEDERGRPIKTEK